MTISKRRSGHVLPTGYQHLKASKYSPPGLGSMSITRSMRMESLALIHISRTCILQRDSVDMVSLFESSYCMPCCLILCAMLSHFSGIQQSPAVGRAISELIIDGKFTSIDLSRFGFDRLVDNEPMMEANIV